MPSESEALPPGVSSDQPSVARIYDYLLDGKDNFAIDRAIGDQIKAALPEVRTGVREQRAVLRRVVRFLVGEAGIRQLVDIGSGLPTAGNVHEIAQGIAPETRVIYVDNDAMVLTHARALLARNDVTGVIEADVRQPATVLAHPELRAAIDLDRPVGLLLCGILHHLTDAEDPGGITATLIEALPSGSHVFIHHLADLGDPGAEQAQAALIKGMGRGQFRSEAEIRGYFHGLEFVPPGLVGVAEWRPEPSTPSPVDHPVLRLAMAGVARKP